MNFAGPTTKPLSYQQDDITGRTWTPPVCQALNCFWHLDKDCTRTFGLWCGFFSTVLDGICWLTPLSHTRTLCASSGTGFVNHGLTCFAINFWLPVQSWSSHSAVFFLLNLNFLTLRPTFCGCPDNHDCDSVEPKQSSHFYWPAQLPLHFCSSSASIDLTNPGYLLGFPSVQIDRSQTWHRE